MLLQFLVEEQSKERTGSLSIQRMLEDVFRLAITSAFPQLANPPVLVTPSAKMADYQCNSAMSLAQVLDHGIITSWCEGLWERFEFVFNPLAFTLTCQPRAFSLSHYLCFSLSVCLSLSHFLYLSLSIFFFLGQVGGWGGGWYVL